MSILTDYLYKKSTSIANACVTLEIDFDQEDLEDLEQCIACDTWRWSYELDEEDFCPYCSREYS